MPATLCVLTLMMGQAAAAAAGEPNSEWSSKNETPPPPLTFTGSYGDADYASAPSEEADLGKVAALSNQVSSLGSFRANASRMVILIPLGAELPATTRVGAFDVIFRESAFTMSSLSDSLGKVGAIAEYLAEGGESLSYAFTPKSDAIVVTGKLPTEANALMRQIPNVTIVGTSGAEAQTRGYDPSPHWGGAAIADSGYSSRCTSGFKVLGSSGTYFMTTAGHCFDLNEQTYSPHDANIDFNPDGAHVAYGQVTRRNYSDRDIELISGSTYSAYIYMGGIAGAGYPVSSAQDPSVGSVLCVSGTTTFENCGKEIITLQATVCYGGTCRHYLTQYSGGVATQGGDSGAPLVNKGPDSVGVRGIHVAGDGGNTNMYATRWGTIAAEYPGLKIVLG